MTSVDALAVVRSLEKLVAQEARAAQSMAARGLPTALCEARGFAYTEAIDLVYKAIESQGQA